MKLTIKLLVFAAVLTVCGLRVSRDATLAQVSNDSDESLESRNEKQLNEYDLGVAKKKWTYERLVESSDAVVIGEFTDKIQVEVPESQRTAKWLKDPGIVAMESRFKVLSILRPDKNWKQQPESVRVIHFNRVNETLRLRQSAELIDFSIVILRPRMIVSIELPGETIRKRTGEPEKPEAPDAYLMFLSARTDGLYQPVTGQYFPGLSFRRMSGFDE
jgi:hypothetical protein